MAAWVNHRDLRESRGGSSRWRPSPCIDLGNCTKYRRWRPSRKLLMRTSSRWRNSAVGETIMQVRECHATWIRGVCIGRFCRGPRTDLVQKRRNRADWDWLALDDERVILANRTHCAWHSPFIGATEMFADATLPVRWAVATFARNAEPKSAPFPDSYAQSAVEIHRARPTDICAG